MDKFSGLSDDLLVKILTFVPTKDAVSTSILSKRWKFLWMWLPKLDYDIPECKSEPAFRDFINKRLPLHRAPVIDSFSLEFGCETIQPDDIKLWAGIAVSRRVRELSIRCGSFDRGPHIFMPSSLYTCKSLVSLRLCGTTVFVDVPRTVSLPSLKTLELGGVTYSDEDSLRLLLSYCPVLEDLAIDRCKNDNMKALVVIASSLQRLSVQTDQECSDDDGYVIVTPCLKYFKVNDDRDSFSYLIEKMPKLEEADISVVDGIGKLLESVTSVKRLSLYTVLFQDVPVESVYRAGIVFSQLEHLELCTDSYYWSKLLFRLLNDSPKLRVLSLEFSHCEQDDYETFDWNNDSVPRCLLESLESFKFKGYIGSPDERDFLSFLFKNACCLKSSSIEDSPW